MLLISNKISNQVSLVTVMCVQLQHADAFPESDTMSYATQTNGLFSNPISKRDMDAYNDVLGKSKHISQGKRTTRSSDPISVDHQLIELPPTMKKTI